MMKFLTSLCLGFTLLLSLALDAAAKPEASDIQILYSEYKTALGDTNYAQARRAAEKVWKASETVYGDSRQTGDFAYNYAVIAKSQTANKINKRIGKAFKRSIALAHFHGDKTSEISMHRHLYYATYLVQVGKYKQAAPILQSGGNIARQANLTKGEIYLKIIHLQANVAYNLKQYKNAKTHIDNALNILGTAQLSKSQQAYKIEYSKATIEEKLGNWKAALSSYEKTYTNVDRVLDMKDEIIGRAFIKEGRLRREIRKTGDHSDEDIAAVSNCIGCWPNIEENQRVLAEQSANYTIKRTPPGMPKNAMSSGFVIVKYDTDDLGVPTNLHIVGASHSKTFDAATVLAIQRWRVYEGGTKIPAKHVKDLVTTMTFYLANQRGKILDFYGNPIP